MGYKSLTHDSVRRAAKERPPRQDKPEPKNRAAVALGRLGGKAKGPQKARGDAQYYRDLQAKSAEKRREKANERA